VHSDHNKESLVLIRSVKRGLILHFLFFKDEIRDFDAIAKGEDIKLPSEQLELGRGLIEKMSSPDFEPERYADEYRERALAMIEKKVKGNARRKQATLIPMMAVTENSVSTCGVSHHEPRRGTNNPRLPRKPTIKPFISLIPL
jgi:DNA end-binding protein Ku